MNVIRVQIFVADIIRLNLCIFDSSLSSWLCCHYPRD